MTWVPNTQESAIPIKIHLAICLVILVACWPGDAWPEEQVPDGLDADPLPEFDCVMEPSEIVDVGSAVPGVIEAIYALRSDPVEKGAVIAELESSVERATLALSKARAEMITSIELRQESAAFGLRTRERNQALVQNSAISKQDIDKLETEKRIGQLQVRKEEENKSVAQLEYRRAEAALKKLTIRAPFDGVVMERFKAVGEYVEDKPILRVAKLNPLHVELIVPVEYLGRLQTGMRAEVTPLVPGYGSYSAVVTRIDRVADAASGTFGARLSLPNPDYDIPSGLRCRLAFLPVERPQQVATAPKPPDDTRLLPAPAWDAVVSQSIAKELSLSSTDESSFIPLEAEKHTAAEADQSETEVQAMAELKPFGPEVFPIPAPKPNVTESVVTQEADNAVGAFPLSDDFISPPYETDPSDFIATTTNVVGRAYPSECYTVGPLIDMGLTSRLTKALSDKTSESTLDTKYIEYVVLAGADGSATRALLEIIKAAGIDNFYVFAGGRQEGRISLGVYIVEENALIRQQYLLAMGVNARVLERYRQKPVYWLNLSLVGNAGTASNLQDVASTIAPNANVQRADCEQMQAQRAKSPDEVPLPSPAADLATVTKATGDTLAMTKPAWDPAVPFSMAKELSASSTDESSAIPLEAEKHTAAEADLSETEVQAMAELKPFRPEVFPIPAPKPNVTESVVTQENEHAVSAIPLSNDFISPPYETEPSDFIVTRTDVVDRAYPGECYTVGPLGDMGLASQLSDTLTAKMGEPKVDTDHTQYLVVAGTDALATAALLEVIKAAGIDDFYVFLGGRQKGRISLGAYIVEENALIRQRTLLAMGINARVLKRNREKPVYWLNLSLFSGAETGTELLNLVSIIAPNASVQRTDCKQMRAQLAKNS